MLYILIQSVLHAYYDAYRNASSYMLCKMQNSSAVPPQSGCITKLRDLYAALTSRLVTGSVNPRYATLAGVLLFVGLLLALLAAALKYWSYLLLRG